MFDCRQEMVIMDDERIDEFRAHVERCMFQACGTDELVVDADGDWPIDVRGTDVYVRVSTDPVPHVHVFGCIATAVSEQALAEINHLNAVMNWAKLVRTDTGEVIASQRLLPAAVNAAVLDQTIEAVANYSRDCGPLLEAVYADSTDDTTGRTTPAMITSLPENGIFVFGSGKSANHSGGAARLAHERFGAERGVGAGLRGHSYAIPTMSGFLALQSAVASFIQFASARPELDFYVTRLGCGHAGYEEGAVAALFALTPPNVIKPAGW